MIRFFILILGLSVNTCFAQNSQTLFSRTNFDAWKSEYSDSTYQVYVDLFKASQLYVDNKDFYEEGYLEQHITLMDFDRDGLDDIVFEGFLNGGESEHVVFLHRTLFGLDKIFDVMGYVTEVSHPSASNLQLTIKHYGCCDNVITNIEQYTLVDLDNQPSFTLIGKYAFVDHVSAIFPTSFFHSPIQFETTQPAYSLRFMPEINDSTEYTRYLTGNRTGIYPGGSIGVALAEKTDDAGRIWWFVYMKNNLAPIELYVHPGFNNIRSPYVYGWMSSRYLTVLE